MISEENRTIHGLWIGDQLSYIEQLTIRSFIRHGHEFHLWVYSDIVNLPEGVVIRDANIIIPEKDIIRRKYNDPVTGVGKGSVGAPFSDIFRYKLLYEYGGWWVDMDMTCLRPLDFDEPYFFRSHLLLDVIGNLMKCPKGSELMLKSYEEALATCDENTLDWLGPNKILNRNIRELDLLKYRKTNVSNRDEWPETLKYLRGNQVLPESWYVIHWSNEEWRMRGIDKNNLRLRNTRLGSLLDENGIRIQAPNRLKMLRNELRLLNVPRNPAGKVFWFFAGHLRYWYHKVFRRKERLS